MLNGVILIQNDKVMFWKRYLDLLYLDKCLDGEANR